MNSNRHNYWVYILTNWKKTVLYVGVTNNLNRRLREHYAKRGKQDSFTGKYYCYNLVYYEWHQYVRNAIGREKEIKNLLREKKEVMITEINPEWKFLNVYVCGEWPPKGEQ